VVEEEGRGHFESLKQISTKLSQKTIASFFGGSTNHNVLLQDEKRPRIEEGAVPNQFLTVRFKSQKAFQQVFSQSKQIV